MIGYMLASVMPFKSTMLSVLSATEVSIMVRLCGIELTQLEAQRYLNPIRDMGSDTNVIITAIEDPMAYWKMSARPRRLRLHLVVWKESVNTDDADETMGLYAEPIEDGYGLTYDITRPIGSSIRKVDEVTPNRMSTDQPANGIECESISSKWKLEGKNSSERIVPQNQQV
ncbi:MAG: hypothetical protein M1823_003822 [Watsoniomyces obsoletus]|nr:MAG: hypothetical protein M1823_003822 [Watsoniomyces obsoletus]